MELDANSGEISSIEVIESKIDNNMDNSFVADSMDEDTYCHDSYFLTALSTRTEMSKMMGSIGSVVVCNAPCNIFAKPASGDF